MKSDEESPYYKCSAHLFTKHNKSLAIRNVFLSELQMKIIEYEIETDALGTFSGEVPRHCGPIECARRKCEIGINLLGDDAKYCLASEGSFFRHPYISFLPCNQEVLYFVDNQRNFHLHLTHISNDTNYKMQSLDSLEELFKFAESAKFPSHALILRPNDKKNYNTIFKGIKTKEDLIEAFKESIKQSSDHKSLGRNRHESRLKSIENESD